MQSPLMVLNAYPVVVLRTVALGSAGGFSGAEFWRVETPAGPLCLRRWPPEHPSPERLRSIHQVLRHVHQRAVTEVPVPLQTRDGGTFVRDGDRLWELAPWMPGTADYHRHPTLPRLNAAMRLLARFHRAAATCPPGPQPRQTSPGLRQRLELLDRLLAGEAQQIVGATRRDAWAARKHRSERLLEAFFTVAPGVRASLSAAAGAKVDLQPCLRDVWHDHVLFVGDQATGLIDFGALRDECVVGDVARLLGSLVRGDRATWQIGLAAYQAENRLAGGDLGMLDIFYQTGVLLSGVNWLRWMYLENRVFEDLDRVFARIDENLEELQRTGGER
jgi:Ser/Thr protein kinase RdoA (MazF antagonist)